MQVRERGTNSHHFKLHLFLSRHLIVSEPPLERNHVMVFPQIRTNIIILPSLNKLCDWNHQVPMMLLVGCFYIQATRFVQYPRNHISFIWMSIQTRGKPEPFTVIPQHIAERDLAYVANVKTIRLMQARVIRDTLQASRQNFVGPESRSFSRNFIDTKLDFRPPLHFFFPLLVLSTSGLLLGLTELGVKEESQKKKVNFFQI